MNRFCIAMLALSALACSPKAAENSADSAGRQLSATPDRAEVKRGIDSALARFRDGIMTGDTAKIISAYTADAIVLAPNLPLARGHAGIGQLFTGMLSAYTFTAAKMTTLDLILTGEYAIETGTFEMTMRPKTGASIADVGKYVSVWQKQSDGSWKMVRDIFNSDKAAM